VSIGEKCSCQNSEGSVSETLPFLLQFPPTIAGRTPPSKRGGESRHFKSEARCGQSDFSAGCGPLPNHRGRCSNADCSRSHAGRHTGRYLWNPAPSSMLDMSTVGSGRAPGGGDRRAIFQTDGASRKTCKRLFREAEALKMAITTSCSVPRRRRGKKRAATLGGRQRCHDCPEGPGF